MGDTGMNLEIEQPIIVSDTQHVIWAVLDKYERMDAVLELEHMLPRSHFMRILGEVWVNVDNGEDYWPEVALVLHKASPKYRRFLMNEEDLAAYDALPEWVTIYRGDVPDADDAQMPSWSLDHAIAVKFANTESPSEPVVYRALVHKSEIYACFTGRGEAEVLFDPAWAETFGIEEIEELEPKSEEFERKTNFYKAVQRQGIMSPVSNHSFDLIHAGRGPKHFATYMEVKWQHIAMLRQFGLHKWADVRQQTIYNSYADERIQGLLATAPFEGSTGPTLTFKVG